MKTGLKHWFNSQKSEGLRDFLAANETLQKEMNVLCAYVGMHIKGRPRLGDRPLQINQALKITSINNI